MQNKPKQKNTALMMQPGCKQKPVDSIYNYHIKLLRKLTQMATEQKRLSNGVQRDGIIKYRGEKRYIGT